MLFRSYCGYGEFYSNYDRRETGDQSFENVKLLVDYLTKLWCSDYNVSHKNEITIGFYGGEPLLNMKLVKETIAYIESLNLPSLIFNYNTTTNALGFSQMIELGHQRRIEIFRKKNKITLIIGNGIYEKLNLLK